MPDSVPAWKTGAGGHDFHHDVGPASIRADGEAAADDLAEDGHVGQLAEQFLRAAEGEAEAGHDLVVDQHRPVMVRQPAQLAEELGAWHDEAHVARDRHEDDARDLVAAPGEGVGERLRVAVGQ